MEKIKKIILLVFILLLAFTVGCTGAKKSTQTGYHIVNGKPSWVWQPTRDGRLGGVGIAGVHFKGKPAQRMLAISRALDEIARQKGVKVDTQVNTEATVSGGSANTKLQVYSKQYSNGVVVTATLVEFWEDVETEELYVWMVE